ncbi:unnamed protein product [Closterium sp. NIES-65]|nr:unnamed protein product [Closterium sp. NIES-65]
MAEAADYVVPAIAITAATALTFIAVSFNELRERPLLLLVLTSALAPLHWPLCTGPSALAPAPQPLCPNPCAPTPVPQPLCSNPCAPTPLPSQRLCPNPTPAVPIAANQKSAVQQELKQQARLVEEQEGVVLRSSLSSKEKRRARQGKKKGS